MKILSGYVILMLLLIGCSKKKEPCNQQISTNFGFKTYEYVLDTLLQTDTAFAGKDVVFGTNEDYSNFKWNIGNDQRVFMGSFVRLQFPNPEVITAKLTADTYNSNCLPETKTVFKTLVIVKNDGSIVSPLRGTYLGANQDNLGDTFRVKISFWIGSRYPWWSTGAYTIDNLPKGYRDSTRSINGTRIPEITGLEVATGYKNLVIREEGYLPALSIKGSVTLNRGMQDTLLCTYTILDTMRRRLTGQTVYIPKKFIGIKQ